jgi:hypothetical protein
MRFILGVKPKDHKSLTEDIEGLRRGGLLEHYEWKDTKGSRYRYEWVNEIPLDVYRKGEAVNHIEFRILNAEGEQTYHNSWATDIEVNAENVKDLVKGGRAGFSSRKWFWSAIRATFRLLLFYSWEQMLQRMNSTPNLRFRAERM